jgi:hypothetical protein
MDKIIKFSKIIELNQNAQIQEQKSLYDTLVNELRVGISGHNLANSFWHLHKKQNTPLYQSLTNELNRVAMSMLRGRNNIEITIEARNKIKIPLEFAYLSIEEYDWQSQAIIEIYFNSIELTLLENFGSAILLKASPETNQTFIVDIDDKELTIIEYTQK